MTQADEDVPGALFDCLRADGVAAFEVSEYAEAESARELAELCREAVDELGGELIKAVRAEKKPMAAPTSAPALDETLAPADDDTDGEDDVEGWLADRRQAREKHAANTPPVNAAPVKTPSRTVQVEKPVLRDSRSTGEAAEMKALMAAVEARRLSQRKSKPAKSKTATKSASSALARSAKSATGAKPESAAARERRIKAALAEEKKSRQAAQEAKVAEQADEMAAILARLDERGKAAERYRRRR
ncbi:hypothetical protein L1F30_14050 [Simiduia sp. 21SJ11W-1]|uniref:hypothetical protein n=1 Tax=Simiduia sp. 21SJ11W-1 TaxID=2909669 RepID=UPI0020A1910D|nr:hypothetical protein [Simiduia sp. 21SJ11W-1]UTA47280.1 hypothetical protein L1F30_14050 [Simiduia sp. 21SJ11W-1]